MKANINHIMIGAFVLVAVALLVTALSVVGSGKLFKRTIPIVMYFEGSVNGLYIGSPVMLRGVQVGTVTNIAVKYDPRNIAIQIPVYGEFDPAKISTVGLKGPADGTEELRRMIERGLRARMEPISLVTGQRMINLDFVPSAGTSPVSSSEKPLRIPTIPSTLEELGQRLEHLPIEETIRSIATLTNNLNTLIASPMWKTGAKEMVGSIQELRALLRETSARIAPLADELQATLQDTRSLVSHSDTFVRNLDSRLVPLSADAEETLQDTRFTLAKARETMEALQKDYGGNSDFHFALMEITQRLADTAHSIEILSEYLRRHPESILRGAGKQR